MKNVRIWFNKISECKYISHLDLNRVMLRAVRRAQLPMWVTEGFNPHPFVTFPLPISLGISGHRECMDIRIIDDSFDISLIPEMMNPYLPEGIQVFKATYPKYDPKFIAFAQYRAEISAEGLSGKDLLESILNISQGEDLIIKKKSKAGFKDVDMLPYVKAMKFDEPNEETLGFTVTLPAGNVKNIGLPLVLKAIENSLGKEIAYSIDKLDMFTEEMAPFA